MKKKQTKWLDNFGKAENANESNVSLPENFNGLAYDTSYRDYSPAWGGQFQQGGSIPGSVGFTYARTGSTPSEGKYAKKTMPSAQNGKTYVSTSSPEYKKLYENRQIGKWLDNNIFDSLVPLDEITVTPNSETLKDEDGNFLTKFFSKLASDLSNKPARNPVTGVIHSRESDYGGVNDLYNKYFGQPLKTNTVQISKNRPTKEKDKSSVYYSVDDDLFKQQIVDEALSMGLKLGETKLARGYQQPSKEYKELLEKRTFLDKLKEPFYQFGVTPSENEIALNAARERDRAKVSKSSAIGGHQVSRGVDENGEYISYYDKFDRTTGTGSSTAYGTGHPFELYDRIYIDPKTGKPKLQNGGEMKFYQEGLDWKPKSMRDGGIIKDNQGYWNPDNWGKMVEIDQSRPDSFIDMTDVYEPLLAVSNKGEERIMYPGEKHKFKGSKVTEIPIAQEGIQAPYKLPEYQRNFQNYDFSKSKPSNANINLGSNKGNFLNKFIANTIYPYGDLLTNESEFKIDNSKQNEIALKYKNEEIDIDDYRKLLYDNSINSEGKSISEIYKNKKQSKPMPHIANINPSKDALLLHQGLRQRYDSFVPSKYKPNITDDSKNQYSRYSLNDKYESEIAEDLFKGRNKDFIKSNEGQRFIKNSLIAGAALKNYKYSKGKDEIGNYISYYDLNDYGNILDYLPNAEPFEIYGRIYYDPETGDRIDVKKNGGNLEINNLDAQPMKKLNQLLNFTNNPDKTNWLDKYQ